MENRKPQLKVLMAIVIFLFGGLGIHRYLMGYKDWYQMMFLSISSIYLSIKYPIIGSIFLLCVGIWIFYDFVRVLTGRMKMADGQDLT